MMINRSLGRLTCFASNKISTLKFSTVVAQEESINALIRTEYHLGSRKSRSIRSRGKLNEDMRIMLLLRLRLYLFILHFFYFNLFLCVEMLVPGVLYGKDSDGNNVPITIATSKIVIVRELRSKKIQFENTLYNLVLSDGSSHKVLARQLQINSSMVFRII